MTRNKRRDRSPQLKITPFIGIVGNLCGKFSISEHANRVYDLSVYRNRREYVCTNKQICLTRARKIPAKIPIFVFSNADGEYPACNFRKKRKPTTFTACFNARPRVIYLFSRQTAHAVQEIKLFLP